MWSVSIAIAAVVFVLWIIWRKRRFSVFKDLGIPGPEPSLLFGNLRELSKEGPLECHKRWIEKYGRVVGYYFGVKPIILVADVDLLKKIQVSDFQKFMDRPRVFQPGGNKEIAREGFAAQIVNLRGKRWKEVRSILTPTFTASKMKMMSPIINDTIDTLIENIDIQSKKDAPFDIYKLYQSLTMDVIGRTAFGINTDVQRNPDDPFLRSSKALLSGSATNFFTLMAFSFPEFGSEIWIKIASLRLMFKNRGQNPFSELVQSVKGVIRLRRTDKSSRRNDLLQLMIDAKVSDLKSVSGKDLTAEDNDTAERNQVESEGTSKLLRQMSDSEILDNSVLFFLAGYGTTSTALGFTTHFLVHYPEVQERIRKEVNDLVDKEGELNYTSVQKLQYLDQVFKESLRMYPPVYLFVNREIGEDIQFGGMKFKKGLPVQVPVYTIQHDPELWPEPEKFDPERFSPENKSRFHPMAWQPFGAGPRNCVGMRFAQMEVKLTLAKILRKYRLVPCEGTDNHPLTLDILIASIKPGKGVVVKAILC